ncbi:DUF397 domain-containing protein [Paractinoplanes durhamensis]|uniref:DUF397 domain-containing protein n=1 Tax=Paractinoplanes durhamensis TaxID=113563 RepID=A0ABQ3YPQ4_9ACTN|nr:DUF397 domain-containing protein [Actinoplanes durhamensis]GID99564.1 hypothetical protein Adu01nite_09150 [Actinoplanes durhamensis]
MGPSRPAFRVKAKLADTTASEGNCVEVATNLPSVVAVRDTKNRANGTLLFTSEEWKAFITDLRHGEFDL